MPRVRESPVFGRDEMDQADVRAGAGERVNEPIERP
jgi:hypothetical protein